LIVDTSAVVSILTGEPQRSTLESAVANNDSRLSSISLLEASIVLMHRLGEESLTTLDAWIEAAGVEVEPFTPAQARIARLAYMRFGKGRHPAGLNFGDCASYALAMERGDELLYVGDDFGRTDVPAATV
jgi:ribonuclease VapC